MSNKQVLGILAIAVLVIPLIGRQAFAFGGGPTDFVAQVGGRAIDILNNGELPLRARRMAFAQDIGPAFDVGQTARFVFGRYWLSTTPAERSRLLGALDDYLVSDYWARLSQFVNARSVITGE